MQIKSTKAYCFVLLKTKMSSKRTKEPTFVLLENRTSDYETNTHTDNHRRTFSDNDRCPDADSGAGQHADKRT